MKHFTQAGNIYTFKQQRAFNAIIILLTLVFAFLGYYANLPALMWICLAVAVLMALAVAKNKLYIDMDKREIHIKVGLVKPVTSIPLENIETFEFGSLRYIFVRINVSLTLYYMEDGKERSLLIAQGLSKKAMQDIYNEIQEIIGDDQPKG